MKALSSFFPFVIPFVDTCTSSMAEQAVLSACIEFCEKTLVVQRTYVDNVVVGFQDYDISVPGQMSMTRVIRVNYADKLLTPAPLQSVNSGLAMQGEDIGEYEVERGEPTTSFTQDPLAPSISLYPVPETALLNGLTIRAAFAPSRSATQVDDVLFDDYAEDIASGALSRLFAMPGQPFHNPSYAEAHTKTFSGAIRSAVSLARTGQVVASSRVRPVRFV